MTLDVTRVRGLLFDIDGTLSDTDNAYVARVARFLPAAFGSHRQRLARRLVMASERPGNLLFALLDELGLERPLIGLVDAFNRTRRTRPDSVYPPVPGVPELLASLHGRYPMAVVSARGELGVRRFLDMHGLSGYFGAVATALTCKRSKPFPDPVIWAAEQLDLPPANCVMIGDTTVDIRAGKSAGAQTIGVLCGFGEENELRRFGANVVLATTADIVTLLPTQLRPR